MKFLPTYIFGLLLLLCNLCIFSQDVNYYVLGENELKNADIYSILQTQNQRLYVATNEGLYEYKHGAMNVVRAAKGQQGISLFNLRENSKGEVFCYNLRGQIFKVQGNKLSLYTRIPSRYLAQSLAMEFDEDDHLIFASKGCFIITKNKVHELGSTYRKGIRGISKLPDGRLFLVRKEIDTLLQVIKGKIVPIVNNDISQKPDNQVFIYQLNNRLIYSNNLNTIVNSEKKRSPLGFNTVYTQFNDSVIWRRNYTSGVETIKEIHNELVVANTYFDDVFISEISKGPTGLLFFGTFGKGLFVVPNLNSQQHNLEGLGNNIQSIAADSLGNVFISDRMDGIFSYNKKILQIENTGQFVPEQVFSVKLFKGTVQPRFPLLFYNKAKFGGAIKNLSEIDATTLLLSTSLGVVKYGERTIISDSIWSKYNLHKNPFLTGIRERCTDAVYSTVDNELYISTISSLIKISSNGKRKKMLFKEQPIIANDLLLYGTELWVATQDHGILIFKNGELTRQLIDKHGLEDRSIYKIQERDDQIYISHKSGFQIYSPITNDWKTIGRPEGIESGTSEDFALGHDNLWFAGNAKLLSLPINNIPDPTIDFRVQIDSILIGNQKVVISEEGAFDYKQNKLSVHLDFKGILFEEEAYYSYRLEGLDKNTKQIPATESEITYNYLPPGSYSFSVTAHYRDSKNDSLAYNFTIKKPYWQRWWFLTIIGIALSLVLLIIIFLRNKKMKRENEEWLEQQMLKTDLIESELKALRSQMNPHFVFNSLNSIQDLILQKDTDASYDYIVLFSNLVRNALSYSNEAFILLEKEIDFLETYLKLEKLRFGDNFSYTIDSNASKTIQVPSLIVQPFVENAIVHGLFHKQSERILSIYFELRDTLLICTIIDNGVGRTKALEIQQRQGTDHTSFALNSIHKRLQILKKKYDASIGFTITDLYDDETKTASGTKVEITLPYLN